MNITSDPNLWAICILVFLLGLMIGVLLTAGGRRKWRERYRTEVDRREALERDHAEREKEWRERDSLRGAAARDRDRDDRPL